MSTPNVPADAAKQPGAGDEAMPNPAAAVGESAPDSPGDQPAQDTAPAVTALEEDLRHADVAPDLATGTDIDIDVAPEPEQPSPDPVPATSDPAQMAEDPTDLGGVAGEGGAG